jgi:hypothetical protein
MKQHCPSVTKSWIPAAVGAISLLAVSGGQAAFVSVPFTTTEAGSLPLGAGSTIADTGAGTVLAFLESPYVGTVPSSPLQQGILRSMVVDPGAPGGPLDFYYQVINTSTGPILFGGDSYANDIYRLSVNGFNLPTISVQAAYRTDATLLDGLTGVPAGFTSSFTPNKVGSTVWSADHDFGATNDAAFYFDQAKIFDNDPSAATDAPNNINDGSFNVNGYEASNWLVLRTNYDGFSYGFGGVIGQAGTGLAGALTPIPEPSTIIFGVAMFGLCAGGRFRKAHGVQNS